MALTIEQVATFKTDLVARRQSLQQASDQTETDRAPVELDQQSVGRLSRMNAMQVQAMSQAQQRQREADLRRIAAALSRIEDGEFGYCNECGELIAEKRLQVDPAASQCITCAARGEKR
uniref:TraR/DksA family transcriptional regulator n=1 Tax=Pararhizobium sp. IMCC3301 TaxID=3067904 RepID=UPI002740745B|nr:TraR/DksA family transcriptional regulator [Pararhizobium sp. IMCC3301]